MLAMPEAERSDTAGSFSELSELARSLEPGVRRLLSEEWAMAARFEHASIASFNKFSLELLAVGAPGELVASANRAALQEVEHAQACFAAASAYAGRGMGPGPLPVGVLTLEAVQLPELVRATVAEGCVGESLAAAEALDSQSRTTVAVLQVLLAKIGREEREHAALAYRFVRWACQVGGERVRAAARDEFERSFAACRAEVPGVARPPQIRVLLAAHGRVCEPARTLLRQRTIAEVLEPLSRELLG
jgi:hypothetical protein